MKKNYHICPVTQEFIIPLSREKKLPRKALFYIITGKKLHLIDAGVAGALDIIKSLITGTGNKNQLTTHGNTYTPGDVESLFLTHAHPDHIGGAYSIVHASGCTVYAHKTEVPCIEDTDFQFKIRPVPGFKELVEGNISVNTIIEEKCIYSLEPGLTIEVFHTPGHSPGSVSYLIQETGELFTGDSLILPGELPICNDGKELIKTITTIRDIKGLQSIYTAWGTIIHQPDIKKMLDNSENYLKNIKEMVRRAADKVCSSDREKLKDSGFCSTVLASLGFPAFLANPLMENSFLSFVD